MDVSNYLPGDDGQSLVEFNSWAIFAMSELADEPAIKDTIKSVPGRAITFFYDYDSEGENRLAV